MICSCRVAINSPGGVDWSTPILGGRIHPMDGLSLAPEIADYYDDKDEARRLVDSADGRLELIRTQEILRRFLPAGGLAVLDVGGAAGIHTSWLTADGHDCTIVDPMPQHVAAAREAGFS